MQSRRRINTDSGNLVLNNNVLVALGEVYVFPLDERFRPYDLCTIFNKTQNTTATGTIEVNVNNQGWHEVPAGSQKTYDHLVSDVRFRPSGSADIGIGMVELNYRNSGYLGKEREAVRGKILQTGLTVFNLARVFRR